MINPQVQHVQSLIATYQFRAAEAALKRYIRRDNGVDDAIIRWLSLRIRLRLVTNRPFDVLHDIERITSIRPSWATRPDILEHKADAYFGIYEISSVVSKDIAARALAKPLYQQIISSYPKYQNMGWVQYQLGRILLSEGAYEAAQVRFEKALTCPNGVVNTAAFCNERLAFIAYYYHHHIEQALIYLENAIQTYPKSSSPAWLLDVYLMQSRVLAQVNPQSALELLDDIQGFASELHVLDTVIPQILLQRLHIFELYQFDIEPIFTTARELLRLATTFGKTEIAEKCHMTLADCYLRFKQYDDAYAACERLLYTHNTYPFMDMVLQKMAMAAYELGRYDIVVKHCEMYTQLYEDSGDYHVYQLLGNSLFMLGDYVSAEHAYTMALLHNPTEPDKSNIEKYQQIVQRLNAPL